MLPSQLRCIIRCLLRGWFGSSLNDLVSFNSVVLLLRGNLLNVCGLRCFCFRLRLGSWSWFGFRGSCYCHWGSFIYSFILLCCIFFNHFIEKSLKLLDCLFFTLRLLCLRCIGVRNIIKIDDRAGDFIAIGLSTNWFRGWDYRIL